VEAGALLIVSNRIGVTEEAGVPCLCGGGGGGGGGDCRDMHSKIKALVGHMISLRIILLLVLLLLLLFQNKNEVPESGI
jgi:hypothetical protein